jgi:uroporphyrinogen-III decarboxylase
MTDAQWQILLNVIDGKALDELPAGFIIDSPWLPGWSGISTLDYYTSDELWFAANRRAVETFPGALFLPGFWSEYGMCTEPSAFGSKCVFHSRELPFAGPVIETPEQIDRLTVPDAATAGLAPFMLNRLVLNRRRVEELGHAIRFAVVRGPLNVASFLMGATEFLISLRTEPERAHRLLDLVTEYLVRSLELQKQAIDSIDGIFVLDDLVGFCGGPDIQEFAAPYLKRLFSAFPARVRFFHNDADGRNCAPHLAGMGINLFNFSFLHSIEEMQVWTGNAVALVGNIPPRDVLALGTPEAVAQRVRDALAPVTDRTRLLCSCGGGMPDGVSTENVQAFIDAVRAAGR